MSETKTSENISNYIKNLNTEYFKLHKNYEELFWLVYMGEQNKSSEMRLAQEKRDNFRSDSKILEKTKSLLNIANDSQKKRLENWIQFFQNNQTPQEVKDIKKRIDILEAKIHKAMAKAKEGYIDPITKKFVIASKMKMRTMQATEKNEQIRKACFDGLEKLAPLYVKEYVQLVNLKNQYAKELGYSDFYAYKLDNEEKMQKSELFDIFDSIYEKTKYAFKNIRLEEKKIPNLRKPWNFNYLIAGDFTIEEDQYYQFDEALMRWGKSFSALGIDFKNGKIQLDLIDRKGKYNNGFCHWPEPRYLEGGKILSGSSNFTCNVVFGQVGSGNDGMNTLFHEGGHSAHLLNSIVPDACMNTEYSPASTAWAETQSMFLDTVFSSIEWRTRYAKNKDGKAYPFDLFQRKVEKTHIVAPLDFNGMMAVANFEKKIYESKNLTPEIVIDLAKKTFKKYFDRSEDSLLLLGVPHIYSWESSCSYHGYALATLALSQWRECFYKKYGYIVDNPNVGKEMTKVWQLGSTKSFPEFVKIATGKKLSPSAYLKVATANKKSILDNARKKLEKQKKIKAYSGKVKLNAVVRMVHGKELIADSKNGFEKMSEKYKLWLNKGVK